MTPMPARVEARRPNWLPIPGAISAEEKRSARVVEDDFFRKAEIVSFHSNQRHGVLVNDSGERIPFNLHEISVSGDPANIGVGLRVGYDVARTASGHRVTMIKVY